MLYQTTMYEQNNKVETCCFKCINEADGELFIDALKKEGIKVLEVWYRPVPIEDLVGWYYNDDITVL